MSYQFVYTFYFKKCFPTYVLDIFGLVRISWLAKKPKNDSWNKSTRVFPWGTNDPVQITILKDILYEDLISWKVYNAGKSGRKDKKTTSNNMDTQLHWRMWRMRFGTDPLGENLSMWELRINIDLTANNLSIHPSIHPMLNPVNNFNLKHLFFYFIGKLLFRYYSSWGTDQPSSEYKDDIIEYVIKHFVKNLIFFIHI